MSAEAGNHDRATPNGASPQPMPGQPQGFEVRVVRDVRIPTSDPAVTLSGDAWLPVTEAPVPAVVQLSPYRRDLLAGVKYEESMRHFAEHGYGCLLVDVQGVGSSDGPERSMLDAAQGDDGVAAIEWAAKQPWCTGAVGMWGFCANGMITAFTASQNPPALKALITMTTPFDLYWDSFTHAGARSDVQNKVRRAGSNVLQRLLPALGNYSSPQEERRWRQRLETLDPNLMVGNLPSADPRWREWAVDAGSITAPTMFVTGWRDIYMNATIRQYEQTDAPKKLLVGPWMHTLPNVSPLEPIDFLSLALRWWDRWLRDTANGVDDEPPVTVYLQGERTQWRSYAAWPPSDEQLHLSTSGDPILVDAAGAEAGGDPAVIGTYEPDPTIGAQAGLSNIVGYGFGWPVDQNEDDIRSFCAESLPLPHDLLIAGMPTVVVTLVGEGDQPAPQRVVARLTDVDPQGRSRLIVGGVECPRERQERYRVLMRRTAYRVAAGHRLRVALSDSDFPLLRPLASPSAMRIARIETILPIVNDGLGVDGQVRRLAGGRRVGWFNKPTPEIPGYGGQWTVTRDYVNDGVEVNFGTRSDAVVPDSGHLVEIHHRTTASVLRARPEASVASGTYRAVVHLNSGETLEATAAVRCTAGSLWVRGDVSIGEETIYSHTWEAPVEEIDPATVTSPEREPARGVSAVSTA